MYDCHFLSPLELRFGNEYTWNSAVSKSSQTDRPPNHVVGMAMVAFLVAKTSASGVLHGAGNDMLDLPGRVVSVEAELTRLVVAGARFNQQASNHK
eukprot:6078126-Amphidinium_carterae.1